jgi:hypothetical protein
MATAKSEQQAAVVKNVDDVEDKFLDCRDLGHSWRHYNAVEEKKYRTITRVVVCSVCRTERRQVLDLKGYLVRSSYRYAKGYLLKGTGWLTADDRAVMRLRNIRRMSS